MLMYLVIGEQQIKISVSDTLWFFVLNCTRMSFVCVVSKIIKGLYLVILDKVMICGTLYINFLLNEFLKCYNNFF